MSFDVAIAQMQTSFFAAPSQENVMKLPLEAVVLLWKAILLLPDSGRMIAPTASGAYTQAREPHSLRRSF
jgi:hypothetical protein